jgi:ribulose-phosphate 3-epimerase
MHTTARELLEQAPLLSVGVLSADPLRIGEELELLDGIVHVDVMDGVFCPRLTVGPQFVSALPDRFVKDVHLMVDEPLGKLEAYVDAGAAILTIHLESTRHPHRALQSLAGSGVVRGAALNPGTPVSAVKPLLDELELLLVLAVNPGVGGQSFIPSTERRLDEAQALLVDREIVLAVDGGITKQNIEYVAALGVDLIVTGSAVFDGVAPAENARFMREAARRSRGAGLDVTAGGR